MLRYPDVSATHITFVYAGDIWVVARGGGLASRLSSPAGEEMYPRFSPDGSRIAYSANYDGNMDVYVVPALGGEPVRLTHHPMPERVVDWHPDGRVLFVSSRESGRQRYNQFYLVGQGGGLPEKLPVPYGEYASFSPDGQQLAYLPKSQANRTWKRYRGGWAPDIWLFNLRTLDAKKVAANDASDEFPMWHGQRVYFLSDRGAGAASQPLGARHLDGRDPAAHRLPRLRHLLPLARADRHRLPGRRAAVPARPEDGEGVAGADPGRHRSHHAQDADREGRRDDPLGQRLAHGQAGRRSRRAAKSSPCRPSTGRCST